MTKKDEISRDKLGELLFNTIGSISIADIGWWLECKTNDKHTAVERQFIIEAFNALENCKSTIEKINNEFQKNWLTSLDTLQRKPYNTKKE